MNPLATFVVAPTPRGRKWIAARILASVLGLSRFHPKEPIPSEVKRILVIRIDERVGNVLLTTPLLRALRQRFPEAELEVLVSASKRSLVDPWVRTLGFVKKDAFRRPWRFLQQLWRLRRRGYDLAIDASHWDVFSLSSAFLLGLTGARVRVAHDRGEAKSFATHLASRPVTPEHDARTKLRLLAAIGIESNDPRTETALGGGTPPEALAKFLNAELASGSRLVGLLPGSRKLDRRAPLSVFASIGRGLAAHGLRPVVIYGPGEEALARDLADQLGLPLPPPTDLAALAQLLSAMRAVVANDTGPMHLAAALGVPTVSLFLHPDLERWGYREAPHEALPLQELGEALTVERAISAVRRGATGRLD